MNSIYVNTKLLINNIYLLIYVIIFLIDRVLKLDIYIYIYIYIYLIN